MMNTKRKLTVAALVAGAVIGLPSAQAAAAEARMGANKLEGAWVSKVQEAPLQWSFVLVPDASGRRASLHGSIDVGLQNFGPGVTTTPLIGELVMTGPASARFLSVWYGRMDSPGPLNASIVYIGVNRGEIKFTGPGKGLTTHQITYYWPLSDADGDGYPDAGATPDSSTSLRASRLHFERQPVAQGD
jgi:hypothetical protein